MKYACAECGHEQDGMDRRCDECGSVRVVLVSFLTKLFGEDWKNNLPSKQSPSGVRPLRITNETALKEVLDLCSTIAMGSKEKSRAASERLRHLRAEGRLVFAFNPKAKESPEEQEKILRELNAAVERACLVVKS